jgi:hypothetical protein
MDEMSELIAKLRGVVSDVLGSSDRFQNLLDDIEGAGFNLALCIDAGISEREPPQCLPMNLDTKPFGQRLTRQDKRFLQALKIGTD